MSRTRNFDASGVNIRVHTKHAPSEYVALWEHMHAANRYVTYASNALMIGDIRYEEKTNPASRLYGYFYRFLDVDPNNSWFNIVKHKKATDDDVEAVNIPAELKPDLVEIPYVFDVEKHQLYFISSETDVKLSPSLVLKLLERLCASQEVFERFGKVDLTVLTDQKKIDEMLKWPVIRNMTIEIDRPNPTEEEDEAAFYDRLKKRGLSSEIRVYKKADDAPSILPDDEMKWLAKIAADNGVVRVAGKNLQRQTDKASSDQFPLRLKSSYDSNLQTLMDALKTLIDQRRGNG